MANTGLQNKIMALSPYIEIIIRILYWKNISFFSKFSKSYKKKINTSSANFSKIIQYLKSIGIAEGDLLLIHSSYGNLKCTNLNPQEIILELKKLVGENGTIAMPAIRKYDGEPDVKNYLKVDISDKVFVYDVYNTKVQTGALPATMVKMPESVISRFPLNSMVAIGPLSNDMMKNNLNGINPTPCGENSSWKFCLDNDAYIIGLGVDLTGCLTMIHTAEDVLDEKWPVKNWYRKRIFRIIDKEFDQIKIVRERQPKWGTLHWAGRTLCKDLSKKKILISTVIDGILVECIKSKYLIDYLNSKNNNAYPYYLCKFKNL